jgi:putative hydroxymethylpyrimidine transport system substrate-binding protein
MRNYESIDLAQRGFKTLSFFPEEHGVPLYDELILLARRDNAHDPRIRRFLVALRDGTVTLLNHPDEMWQAFVKDHPDLDTRLNHAAWFASLPRLDKNPALLDRSRYAGFQDFMVGQGTLKKALPVDDIATQP